LRIAAARNRRRSNPEVVPSGKITGFVPAFAVVATTGKETGFVS
jgi:hypothetical protein